MRPLTDRYSLQRPIGKGGVGEVYEGWQHRLERPVAIKLLRAELTANAAAVARFRREARTTCLLRHPNVVTVIDVGTADDGRHFVVMELLEGETLADLLDRRGRLPPDEALEIAWQVIRGMEAGEQVGLVHRDLKPENIFVLDSGHVKVLDFGLATLLDRDPEEMARLAAAIDEGPEDLSGEPEEPEDRSAARLTRPGALLGTPRYMAPEQVLGWQVDHRSDLYSFGAILFEMLSGQTPFVGPKARQFMQQHRRVPPPRLETVVASLPAALCDLVDELLEKSPSERPQDWGALAERLRACEEPTRETSLSDDALPATLPQQPFRFLSPFTASNRSLYFGREGDLDLFRSLWREPEQPALIMLTGASGVGKTSFLSARVAPWLEDSGHLVLRVRGTRQPLLSVARQAARALGQGVGHKAPPVADLIDRLQVRRAAPVVIILDQLEEVITTGLPDDVEALRAGLAELLEAGSGRVRVLLSMREDYLGALLRGLHPLPVDLLARTLPLQALGPDDVFDALVGPGQAGLATSYAPFSFEDGLVQEIVDDLMDDRAGEVGPRVQLVGARLWEMVQHDPEPVVIRRQHYRERLGGARGILSRMLDEAISSLGPGDQGVAKELLRALTHLPGSPTSRPAPESELVSYGADSARRRAVLHQLEDRWRVVHGFTDERWPGERVFRVAHEALIRRIQDYGEEGSERNRARQVFHQGLSLWLRGGGSDDDLLPEPHFEIVLRHIGDLVLRTADERRFYERSQDQHNAGWLARRQAERRARLRRQMQLTLVPAVLIALGIVGGQALADFVTLRIWAVRALTAAGVQPLDLSDQNLRGAALSGIPLVKVDLSRANLQDADLRGVDMHRARLVGVAIDGADLRDANLQGADLATPHAWGTDFRGADLRQATLRGDLSGADFRGALFGFATRWPDDAVPPGAVGPRGEINGLDLRGVELDRVEMLELRAHGVQLDAAVIRGSSLHQADLSEASLAGARLSNVDLGKADLTDADLRGALLQDLPATGAILRGADLRDATLRSVDLRHSDLRGANLCGARLEAVALDGADWEGATLCESTTRDGAPFAARPAPTAPEAG